MSTGQPPRKRPRHRHQQKPTWAYFPPKEDTTFRKGDSVLVRDPASSYRCDRGEVGQVDESGLEVVCGLTTRKIYQKDQHRLLLHDFGSGKRVVLVTPETNFFRQLVGYTTPNDRVLEIGFSTGETSKLLATNCRSWVGFDTSDKMLGTCRKMLSESNLSENCHAVVVDALVDHMRARTEAETFGEPTVAFLDIGGNRERINVLRMLSWVLDEFEVRLVVVKSRELCQAIESSDETHIDASTGIVKGGNAWFEKNRVRKALPKHPLKAALVLSPSDRKTPICRYYNYHKNGCKKEHCNLDHVHCHACLEAGHAARDCPIFADAKK